MRMGWAPAAFVAILLLLSSPLPQTLARETAGKIAGGGNYKKKKASPAATAPLAEQSFHSGKANKRQCHHRFNCLAAGRRSGNISTNFDEDDDDKRAIPTGPNPLHNR
ncbi:CLAVATA3/ESR (CLE)-related protein 21 [Apostasia shenzhenica]|uniref:CLAVATA3/ESR (CLE)-related protein 21 n=1 Tax=Apostasia shenzhenica TaxID=1088818 RepID=A0A2I0A1Q2_9ASPA|nr:CLAVATA3/ESR (CLE)-related protein 21 [Apostasia shenzhenica]